MTQAGSCLTLRLNIHSRGDFIYARNVPHNEFMTVFQGNKQQFKGFKLECNLSLYCILVFQFEVCWAEQAGLCYLLTYQVCMCATTRKRVKALSEPQTAAEAEFVGESVSPKLFRQTQQRKHADKQSKDKQWLIQFKKRGIIIKVIWCKHGECTGLLDPEFVVIQELSWGLFFIFGKQDSAVLLPFSFWLGLCDSCGKSFPHGARINITETCHPIRHSILRVYNDRNIFMLSSTALNIICFIRHNLCSIDANLLMGRKP